MIINKAVNKLDLHALFESGLCVLVCCEWMNKLFTVSCFTVNKKAQQTRLLLNPDLFRDGMLNPDLARPG